MQDGSLNQPQQKPDERFLLELRTEADFYGLDSLVNSICAFPFGVRILSADHIYRGTANTSQIVEHGAMPQIVCLWRDGWQGIRSSSMCGGEQWVRKCTFRCLVEGRGAIWAQGLVILSLNGDHIRELR